MTFLKDLIGNHSRLKLISVVAAVLMTAAVIVYVFTVRNRTLEYATDNEINKTGIIGNAFYELLKDQFRMTESVAGEFGALKPQTPEEIKAAFESVGASDFMGKLRFADSEGKVYESDGREYESNVSGMTLYQDAMEGKSSVSRELMIDVSDYSLAIVFGTPVYMDGVISGAMFMYLYFDNMSEMVGALDDSEQNSFLVTDSALNILGKSGNEAILRMNNKFDYYLRQFRYKNKVRAVDIRDRIRNNETISVYITFYSEDYLLIMVPFEETGWYMVNMKPASEIYAMRNSYTRSAIIFGALVIIVFALLGFLSYGAASRMIELERMNAQYALLDNASRSITFSCNPNSRAVDLNGAVEQTFGKEIAELGTVNLVSLLDKLHENDQGLSKNISKAVREGAGKYDCEVRVKEADGGYGWYKLEAIIVRSKSGKVERIIGSLKNLEDQIEKEHVLRNKAETDLLTGLLNKMTMENSISDIIKRRPYSTFAFYIIDMDNFKAVNDNLGHAIGDKVLVDVANKLTLLFNEYDFIGRLGGDEFAVMLVIPENMSNYSSRLIELKAKSLCENLKETYSDDRVDVTVSASIGIAIYEKDGRSFSELYRHADLALYQSKNNGKNQFTFYTPEFEA
ncbi:MAG: diguanylate cyclase [Lachnospiraceae bacterium]|nr:diguanylate cyclase [Lachnospiraceae bacterium]